MPDKASAGPYKSEMLASATENQLPPRERGELQTSSAGSANIPREEEFNARSSVRPELATYGQRLDTFQTWQGKANKHELAEAGMFSNGDGDRTACFHCGIPLKEWDAHDVPWIEHAKFSPICKFLIFMKGCAFISSVLDFYEIRNADFDYLKAQNRAMNTSSVAIQESWAPPIAAAPRQERPNRIRRVIRNVEPREIRSRLDSDQAKMLLDLGYPRELVGQVIGEQLQTEGDDFKSFADLVRAVMNAAQMLGIPLHTDRRI